MEFDDDPAFSGHVGAGLGEGSARVGQSKAGNALVITTVLPSDEGWDVRPASKDLVWALSTEIGGPSIIIKSHVDGLLFVPPLSGSASRAWTHKATNPALSFVIASKWTPSTFTTFTPRHRPQRRAQR